MSGMFNIIVPAGVAPGCTFQVQTADGQIMPVVCPMGVSPGQTIQVQLLVPQAQPLPSSPVPQVQPSPPPMFTWVSASQQDSITRADQYLTRRRNTIEAGDTQLFNTAAGTTGRVPLQRPKPLPEGIRLRWLIITTIAAVVFYFVTASVGVGVSTADDLASWLGDEIGGAAAKLLQFLPIIISGVILGAYKKQIFAWPTHHWRNYLRLRQPPRPASSSSAVDLDLTEIKSMTFTELRYVHPLQLLIVVFTALVRAVKHLLRFIRISKYPAISAFPPAIAFYAAFSAISNVINVLLVPFRLMPAGLLPELEIDVNGDASGFDKLKALFSYKPLYVLIELHHHDGSTATLLARDCRHMLQKALNLEIGGYMQVRNLADDQLRMWTEVDYNPWYEGCDGLTLNESCLERSALSLVGAGGTLATKQLTTGRTDSFISYLRQHKVTSPKQHFVCCPHSPSQWFKHQMALLFDKRHHIIGPPRSNERLGNYVRLDDQEGQFDANCDHEGQLTRQLFLELQLAFNLGISHAEEARRLMESRKVPTWMEYIDRKSVV